MGDVEDQRDEFIRFFEFKMLLYDWNQIFDYSETILVDKNFLSIGVFLLVGHIVDCQFGRLWRHFKMLHEVVLKFECFIITRVTSNFFIMEPVYEFRNHRFVVSVVVVQIIISHHIKRFAYHRVPMLNSHLGVFVQIFMEAVQEEHQEFLGILLVVALKISIPIAKHSLKRSGINIACVF